MPRIETELFKDSRYCDESGILAAFPAIFFPEGPEKGLGVYVVALVICLRDYFGKLRRESGTYHSDAVLRNPLVFRYAENSSEIGCALAAGYSAACEVFHEMPGTRICREFVCHLLGLCLSVDGECPPHFPGRGERRSEHVQRISGAGFPGSTLEPVFHPRECRISYADFQWLAWGVTGCYIDVLYILIEGKSACSGPVVCADVIPLPGVGFRHPVEKPVISYYPPVDPADSCFSEHDFPFAECPFHRFCYMVSGTQDRISAAYYIKVSVEGAS